MEEKGCSASEALLQVVRNRATEPRPAKRPLGVVFSSTGPEINSRLLERLQLAVRVLRLIYRNNAPTHARLVAQLRQHCMKVRVCGANDNPPRYRP